MRVLKFGGSSVGSANTMEQVIAIIRQTAQEVPCVTVLSAMQGTTDALIKAARVAELGDAGYKEVLETIREKHQSAIEQLLDSNSAPVLTRYLEERMTELANLCEGVRLICDLTPKTLDRILSFGELLSTRIVTARLTDLGVETEWHDSRELIRTD